MKQAALFREDVGILRETIRENDGANVANGSFARKVDQLISDFYDDIGELSELRLGDILDLFLIKVLYVERRSRDAETLSYLGRLLERYLQAGELALGTGGKGFLPYMSDLMEETAHPGGSFQNLFEAYRKYGDNALFISGVFPQSLGRKRGAGRMGGAPLVDRRYFATVGRRYYQLAASQDLAEWVRQRQTLLRLAQFFDVYVDALNDLRLPLAERLDPSRMGAVQRFTPSIEAIVTPDIDASLDTEDAKRAFWLAFKELGEWWSALPPY